jgi:hypothetical protein
MQNGAIELQISCHQVRINNLQYLVILRVALQVFRTSVQGMFDQMRVAHITVFVISLVWALFLWLGLARPMLRRSGKESRQIAEMLSQLPPEMDVEGLVAQAIARTGASRVTRHCHVDVDSDSFDGFDKGQPPYCFAPQTKPAQKA